MTAYKKQTRDVWFKGRQVYDPSKKMFEEASDASRKDQEFLRDFEARGKEYSRALDNWNKNQALLDKEKVDFFSTISKTIDTSVKNLVVDGMFLRDQAGIEAADRDWQAKSFEEKQAITKEVNEILKQQSDINWKRTSIAAELRKKGLVEYANFVDGQNSAYKTRIHSKILQEGLNNLPSALRVALGASGPEARKYTILDPTTGESIEFTAAEVNSDPTLSGLKVRAIAEAVAEDHYWTVNPQGIKNDILTSLMGDKVDDIKNKFIQENALQQKNDLISKNLTDLSGEIGAQLNLFSTWDGESFTLTQGKADVLQNNIQNYLNTATAQYAGMGEANPNNKAREALKNSLVEYVTAQGGSQAQAAELVEDILFGRGDVKILFKHHATGKDVTLAELDPFRFGLAGSWKENLIGSDGAFVQGSQSIDQTELLADKGWVPSGVDAKGGKVDYGKLYKKDGTLNELWKGTIQYDWAVRKEAGEKIPDAELAKVMKDFYNYGITNQKALNAIRNFDGDGLTAAKTTERLNQIGMSEIVVDGQLVITEDLEAKFNNKAIIEWAEKNNVEIVDQYYGAEDTTVLAASNADILNAVTENKGLTANTQSVVNDLEAKVREGVKQYQANAPTSDSVGYKTEPELIKEVTTQVLKDFAVNKKDPTHEHFINDQGIAVNAAPKGWFGRTNKKELVKLQNEASLSNLRAEILKNGTFDPETKLLSKEQLTAIRQGQVNYNRRGTAVLGVSDRLPPYILKMAAEANMNPYDFVNKQATNAKLEEWVPMIPSPQTKVLLDSFKPSELATIYRMLPDDVNTNRPIKGFSYKLNSKVNKILKNQGLSELPSELALFNSISDMSTADWKTVGEGDRLGKFQLLTTDVKDYYTRNNLDFNQADFLDDHDLQETVFKDLISRVTSEAWDNAEVYKSGKTSTGSKSKARTLRDIFNRIRYGGYIDDELGQDLNSLHQGNLFMQTFSQY
ncbi:hypothetical protein PROG_00003 [Prochlorococcus phage P-SSP10]|uniref:Uncharacterized protein n=1 Tax=Prochlorococcus phage P-SSP10 TaxID=885867 RepID=M1TW68_9CAUD|nr:hypothetical protein PROG_00003 [Prochlorococcus phage P-SSP10]AGG54659.1 hypothetical protein PROG_00003 [Prochlorococcus phage P-SSP10]